MKNCSGQCIAGTIVAIIFGALFLWTLVLAYHTQVADLRSYDVLPWYVLALIFLAIAKWGKHWAYGCPHCGPHTEAKAVKK
ncbi:MAG: hypothetical protein HY369_04140 [Candidatus Aenigmarchaeota archaeon]|nr:hypothetical protein [Candidatus Aenigmarchaeota archaeon]